MLIVCVDLKSRLNSDGLLKDLTDLVLVIGERYRVKINATSFATVMTVNVQCCFSNTITITVGAF